MYRASIILLALILIGFCLTNSNTQADEKVSIATIKGFWKEREEKVKSIVLDLNCEVVIPKDIHRIKAESLMMKLPANGKAPNPPTDLITKGTAKIYMDGLKMRYALKIPEWNDERMCLEEGEQIEAFNGEIQKQFATVGFFDSTNPSYPIGRIFPGDRSSSAPLLRLAPLMWAIRGVNPLVKNDLDSFQITGQTAMIRGSLCIELAQYRSDGTSVIRYLDPNKNYVMIRQWWVSKDNEPRDQLEATYKPDAVVGWLPESWEFIASPGPKLILESGRFSVTSYQVNVPIDVSQFDIQFPPKTRVIDRTKEKGKTIEYIIQEAGTPGIERPTELQLTYTELDKPQTTSNRKPLIIGILVLLTVVVAATIWYRQRAIAKKLCKEGVQNNNSN